MKKLAILFLAFALLCSCCLVLAACGGDGDNNSSSAAGSSSSAGSSSTANSSSTATSSAATSSDASSAASTETSTDASSTDASSSTSEDTSSATSDDPTAAAGTPMWVTHYNTLSNEGSGVILSEPYEGGNWWLHFAFAPVAGEDGVYELVDINDGIASSGGGSPLTIPEGGFVYALHEGNKYDDGRDYTTQTCANAITAARTWKKGDKFTFTGIDFKNFTEVPTSTPGKDYFDKSDDPYICTATFTKVS